jgi:hypothetical protein
VISDEDLEWIWSYREQLIWFDKCDAAWIEQARKGWSDHEERKEFLKAYSLGRGKSGNFIRNLSNEVWGKLNEIYRESINEGDTATITTRWHEAIKYVREHGPTEAGYECPSFTLKLYWFYQPRALTMYDSNALKALKHEAGEKSISIKNYLQVFEECYTRFKERIDTLHERCGRKCPYPRRTVDFWLWLRGSEKRALILKRFRVSINSSNNIQA